MTEAIWLFLAGALSCDPRQPYCVVDWDVVSAIATSAAVVVAMTAIWVENRHRNRELNRSDWIRYSDLRAAERRDEIEAMLRVEARKSRARRLAKIFDRELSEAARHIIPLIKLVRQLRPEGLEEFRKIYAKPLNPGVFKMHERFVDQLEVFPDMLAIAIVTNMTNWTSMTLFSEGLAEVPGVDLIRLRSQILGELNEVLEVISETKEQLQEYFKDLPGLQPLTFDELREMNAAKAAKQQAG